MLPIKCTKFTIREFDLKDAESISIHANNKNVSSTLRDYFPYPYSKADAIRFINSIQPPQNKTNLGIEIEGEVVGGIGLIANVDVYKHSMELGYWLSEMYWGKGIMTEAIESIVNYGFRYFEVIKIYASVFENNKASMRVLEKVGFHKEAILKKAILKDNVLMEEHRYAIFKR